MTTTCSAESLALGEPLGGTGMVAERWVCVESRDSWGRDPVGDGVVTGLGREGKVLAIRRPGRETPGGAAFTALTAEGGGDLRVHAVDAAGGLDDGELLAGRTLFLVCAHGRRDPCCSRLGIPVYKALDTIVERASVPLVWQCSHTGGHRFAPNVVALPWGVTLGRVPFDRVGDVAAGLAEGRVPLDLYRGRSIYPPEVQAAEVAIRQAHGLDRLDDLRLVAVDGERVAFATPTGEHTRRVMVLEGPTLSKSCGAEPERVSVFEVEEV